MSHVDLSNDTWLFLEMNLRFHLFLTKIVLISKEIVRKNVLAGAHLNPPSIQYTY